MSFNIGETIGPYRIVEQLGQGGMATVYKAYHAALDRYVALKVLHPAFQEDTSFLARFQREARLVAKLEHPNIVPIYDYAEHEGRPYLVMKFIQGETLKARLNTASVTELQVLEVAQAVGAALSYAHKQNILHRDIKPSNVLMAEEGGIYLADFGLARIAQSGEATLTSDMIIGTPQYISPEQALGKRDLDEGTDIYSFGVMLYELTVGKVPFSADTPFSIIHDHIYSPLPLPRQVNPSVTEGVERVLLKTLAKDRKDRYKDVHSLVEAFEHAWREAIAAHPTETLKRGEVPARPTPELPTTLAAGAVSRPGAGTPAPEPIASQVQTRPVARRLGKTAWMWISAAVVLMLGCLVTLWALRSVQRMSPRTTFLPPASQTVQSLPPATESLPSLAQVEAKASDNPGDPSAQLELALAYVTAGLPEKAQEAVTSLEKISGLEEAFYWDAGKQLAGQNAWLLAARLYVDAAVRRSSSAGVLPGELTDRLHEAVYKAFKELTAPDFIPFDRLAKIDAPLGQIANARWLLYHGDPAQGQQILTGLVQQKPDFPLGQLLQSEFSAQLGDTVKARRSLDALQANRKASPWMLSEATQIERNLP